MSIEAPDARGWILDQVAPLEAIETTLSNATGSVLADDAVAHEPSPAFDTSAMDGYAVRPARRLPAAASTSASVVGRSVAGAEFTGALRDGESVRIMTGARVPDGTVAVVRLEDVATDATADAAVVTLPADLTPGSNIRRRGSDHAAGQTVVAAGTPLSASHVAVLASIGHDRPSVVRRPRVGVMSTGDEVAGTSIGGSSIRDANRPGLLALVEASGAVPIDLGVVGDDASELASQLRRAAHDCDAVVTSGGVSVGDHDVVKAVMERCAQESDGVSRWMRVAVRPAKPLMFATIDNTPMLGLPGNPASAFVSFQFFALPVIDRLAGHCDVEHRRAFTAVAATDFQRQADGRLHVVPVVAAIEHGVVLVRPATTHGRHHLAGTSSANAHAYLFDGPTVPAGATLQCAWIPGTGGPRIHIDTPPTTPPTTSLTRSQTTCQPNR